MVSESFTVFTIPGRWVLASSVSERTRYQTIVGTANSKGEEVWVPHKSKKYIHNGAYSDGYSPKDVTSSEITLSKDMSKRFHHFFKKLLVGDGWADICYSEKRYDCHWFAQWISGDIKSSAPVEETIQNAENIVASGQLTDRALEIGEIGVLGCVSPAFSDHLPEHSFVGLEGGKALQAMGHHGLVAISPQIETAQHYMEISDGLKTAGGWDFGVYTSSPAQLVEAELHTGSLLPVQ